MDKRIKIDEDLLPEALAVVGSIVLAALMIGILIIIQGVQ